ncbi:MAG: hypothetical protein IJK75_07870 [Bacteroidales bacterium]|nr:hypothetical protein [Bacteroidales bacterium]
MNSTTIFLLVALILALIALAVAVLAFLKAQKALEKTSRDRIDKLARKTFDQQFDMFYGQKIKNLVHDEFVKQQAKPALVAKDVASVPSSQGNDSSPAATEASEKTKEEGPVEISLPEPVTIYTGSYRTGSFRHTTLTPDEKTIFTITAESKDAVEGVLNIDVNAFEKITLTPDFLEGACRYSGTGTQLHVIQTGTVYKENGSWVVKEPIIAEFK